jgi:hypothetical protein
MSYNKYYGEKMITRKQPVDTTLRRIATDVVDIYSPVFCLLSIEVVLIFFNDYPQKLQKNQKV